MKKNFRKILITHDGSKLANTAISAAITLAKRFSSEIKLLQVIDSLSHVITRVSPTPSPAGGTLTPDIAEEVYEAEKQKAWKNLKKIKIQFETENISPANTYVIEGDPGTEIVKFVSKNKPDLIIMSSHGRSGLKRALLGSVTDHVIRHAHCPVLIVRSGKIS